MFRVFILLLVGVALGLGQALAADPYSGPDFNALVRKADSLTPAESLKAFAVADGFEMELVAVSPDIGQPMNMTFDERGRLWVTSTLEYPYAVPLGQAGRDTIKILEDSNGDGAYDKISLFAGGLNIPTGIYPHRDGVIAWSIPNIWFLRAADGSSITMHSGNSYRVQLRRLKRAAVHLRAGESVRDVPRLIRQLLHRRLPQFADLPAYPRRLLPELRQAAPGSI